jgi:hypothetical protein
LDRAEICKETQQRFAMKIATRRKAPVCASGTSGDLEPACNERLGKIQAADAIRITVLLQITTENGPL